MQESQPRPCSFRLKLRHFARGGISSEVEFISTSERLSADVFAPTHPSYLDSHAY